jgi:hypothetical protein
MNVTAELEAFLEGHRFVWLGRSALECVGLARHMRLDLLICTRYGWDDEMIASRIGAQLISVERETGQRLLGPSREELLHGPFGPAILSALQERPRCLLTSRSSETLEAWVAAGQGRLRILAVPTKTQGPLHDKVVLRGILPELGIEPPPHVIGDLQAVSFADMERRYGLPFVLQLAQGAGGSGTFLIASPSELRALQDEMGEQEVSVGKYIAGLSPNITAVVLDHAVLAAYPAVQLVGVPQCTSLAFRYCGNDFTAVRQLPAAATQCIFDQAQRIGCWLRSRGFRGMFGIDFVFDGQRVYPTEVNPRFPASWPMTTELQHLSSQVPLILAHVVGHMEGGQALLERLVPHWGQPQQVDGAHMRLYNRDTDWRVVTRSLRPGVYSWDGHQATYLRHGLTIFDCRADDEFVLTGNVPRANTRVAAGAHLCWIQTRSGLLADASNRLQPWAAELCDWLYDALALSECGAI